MTQTWELLGKEDVFKNKWRHLQSWRMRTASGHEADFYIQLGYDVVTVAGITDTGQFLVAEEFYIAHGVHVPSLVGGVVDGGDHRETAIHELREEAGCEADEFVYLGSAFMGKYNTTDSHFYLARGVRQTAAQTLEPTEDIRPFFVDQAAFIEMVRDNKLEDIHSRLCAYRALDYLKLLS